ncbi:MAG: universal stress protein [Desulfosarcina sp.]
MATFRILLPYNYSPNDQKAIRFVIDAFGGHKGTQVTLFHAYTPLPTIDVSASPENVKMRSGMTYLSGELNDKEAALKAVGERLVESGFERDAVTCIFKKRVKSAAEEIVDKVAGCNVLVLSRGAGKVTHFFTRSIYARVVTALRGVTICVAT